MDAIFSSAGRKAARRSSGECNVFAGSEVCQGRKELRLAFRRIDDVPGPGIEVGDAR
jgi:hypothetical protein